MASAETSLLQFVREAFRRADRPNSLTPALYFRPVMMNDCTLYLCSNCTIVGGSGGNGCCVAAGVSADNSSSSSSSSPPHLEFEGVLPRLGRRRTGRRGLQYEGKLVMRTAIVDMFHLHYVTQVAATTTTAAAATQVDGFAAVGGGRKHRPQSGGRHRLDAAWSKHGWVSVPISEAALLHFKEPLHQHRGPVFGARLPLDAEAARRESCWKGHTMSLDPALATRANKGSAGADGADGEHVNVDGDGASATIYRSAGTKGTTDSLILCSTCPRRNPFLSDESPEQEELGFPRHTLGSATRAQLLLRFRSRMHPQR